MLDYGKRFSPHRRAAVVLGLITWTLFIGWDVFHGTKNSAFSLVIKQILMLRGIGVLGLLVWAIKVQSRSFENEKYATLSLAGFILFAYAIILYMIYLVPFPYDYLYYFAGLFFVLMFLFGLLRLRSKPAFIVALACVVASAIVFKIKPAVGPGGGDLIRTASYYAWSEVSDLMAFILVGYAVAIELEKTSRSVFAHERELDEAKIAEQNKNEQLRVLNSNLKQSSDDLQSKTDALIKVEEEKRRLAEQGSKEKSYFIAGAIHDVRHPATAMLTLIPSIKAAVQNRDLVAAQDFLVMMKEAGERMNTSFNAVLDLSRIESGLTSPEYDDIQINTLVLSVVDSLRITAGTCGVTLKYRESHHKNIVIRSDSQFLSRALSNLISNGIKYRDVNKSRGPVVSVRVVWLGRFARIYIADNGIGIRQEYWGKIFKPFFQINNPSLDTNMGMGLGLSLANAMIDRLHEHHLKFHSTEGRGSRFAIQLPICEGGGYARPVTSYRSERSFIHLKGKYILLVEESYLVRRALAACLRAYGLIVEEIDSLVKFRETLSTLEMRPDAVITDFELSNGGTGLDISFEVREHLKNDVPVLFLTGDASQIDTSKLSGARVLRKPFLPEDLLFELTAIFGPGRGTEALE